MDKESLTKNVQGLTDEQVNAIVTMCNNELSTQKETVTNEVTGTIYQNLDNDMKTLGYEKPNGTKSYEHIKSVISKLKESAAQIDPLNAKITDLEAQIAKGGDEAIKAQLKALQTKYSDIETQLEAERKSHTEDKDAATKALFDFKVSTAISQALTGVKYKTTVGERIRDLAINDAKAEILKDRTIEFDDKGNAIVRNDKGVILTNPNNLNKPYTLQELLLETAALKEVVENTKRQGLGNENPDITPNSAVLDISGCKSQQEADELIQNHLLGKGIKRLSQEFEDEFTKLRTELNVDKLKPIIF